MAIGISYMGHDGRRVDFTAEGNPAPGSDLDRIVRGADEGAKEARRALTPLSDMMRRAKRPQGPDPRIDKAAGTVKLNAADHRPGTLEDKVAREGSIEAGQAGLKLKGDEATGGDGIYAKKGGRRGFLTLDEIDDPRIKGGIVGEQDAANRFSASSKDAGGGGGAFAENMQSRTEAEVNENTGEVTFWEYTKRWDVTNGRRVGGVSGETKRKICSFFLGGGDRQITYTRPRAPFTVLRSHYKDAEGKTQYEFWAKLLKWGQHRNERQTSMFDTGIDYSTNRLVFSSYDTHIADGVYSFGDYGHYPQRPSGRPRKLVFDSGREALVDTFEERSTTARFHDGCNCWTYIGGSEDGKILGEDCEDGNMSLYGALCKYYVPYKTTYSQPVTDVDLELNFGGPYYLWSKPGIRYSYPGHWNYEWGDQLQMCMTTNELSQHDLFEYLLAKNALVASAFTNEDYDKNAWRKTYVSGGDTLADVIRSPNCNEKYHYKYTPGGVWNEACCDTDKFPSLAHLDGSLVGKADFESHDYTLFDEYYYYSGGRHDVYYPDGIQQYIDFGLDNMVKSWIATESNKLYGPYNDGTETYSSDWDMFYNYKTGTREKYNGKWSDYFPFFISDSYGFDEYLWHYYWYAPEEDEMFKKTPKVCEIRNWEIVDNEVGNMYCYVKENAKGEILDVQLKKFGDIVKDGKEEVAIKDDLVVVEK